MKNKTRFLKDFIIILGISVGLFVLAEGALRMAFPELVKNLNILDSLAYEFNEDYLISLRPNIAREHYRREENGGDVIRWKTNSDSFRGEELDLTPKHRVIVYGDSNIQARFSDSAQTFPGQLARYLHESGITDVEVINAGVVGFGPDQIFIRFSNEIDRFKPDLVIFHVFADNDFGDIIRNRLFELDVDGNLIRTDYKKTVDTHLAVSKDRKLKLFLSQLLTVRAFKKATSYLLSTGANTEANGTIWQFNAPTMQSKKNAVLNILKKDDAEYLHYKESLPGQYSHFADHYDIDIALYPEKESSKIKKRLMEQVLMKASKLAKEKGINLMVLIQPSRVDLTVGNSPFDYEYLQQYPDYKRSNLTAAVEEICLSQDVRSLNLFDVFRENDPQSLFFKSGNNHWTDRGQRLAAKETARYIIDHSMIKH